MPPQACTHVCTHACTCSFAYVLIVILTRLYVTFFFLLQWFGPSGFGFSLLNSSPGPSGSRQSQHLISTLVGTVAREEARPNADSAAAAAAVP